MADAVVGGGDPARLGLAVNTFQLVIFVVTALGVLVGVVVNIVVLARIPFRVGLVFGKMEGSVQRIEDIAGRVGAELAAVEHTVTVQGETLARTVAQLDGLEHRVRRLEDRA